jgi:hypothetical protein
MSTAPSNSPTEPPATSLPPLAPPPPPVAPAPPVAQQSAPPQPPTAQAPVPDRPPNNPVSRALLAMTAVTLFGWFAWLSYAALTKSHDPTISRAQAARSDGVPVVAKVTADEKGTPAMKVTVVESLKPDGPRKDSTLMVLNLPSANGFVKEGMYLLLLTPDPLAFPADSPIFHLVGQRGTFADSDTPAIYPWTPDVEAQARRLFRP